MKFGNEGGAAVLEKPQESKTEKKPEGLSDESWEMSLAAKSLTREFGESTDMTEEDEKNFHDRAELLVGEIGEKITDYEEKFRLLQNRFEEDPFKSAHIRENNYQGTTTPWSPERFKNRLDSWEKTMGKVEGFNYGEDRAVEVDGKTHKISFISPDEVPVVYNNNKYLLNKVHEMVGDDNAEAELKAVNMLNLVRRVVVDGRKPQVIEAKRTGDPALHKEKILITSKVPHHDPGNPLDRVLHGLSVKRERGEHDIVAQTEGELLKIVEQITQLANQEDGGDFDEKMKSVVGKLIGLEKSIGAMGLSRVKLEKDSDPYFDHPVAGVPSEVLDGIVDLKAPPSLERMAREPQNFEPAPAPERVPEAEPVPEPEPVVEAVESKPLDIDKSYKKWEVDWKPKSDRTVERYEGSLDDIQKVINNELLQLLPEGVDPARFLVVASEVARNYTPDRKKPVKNSNGLPFINLLNQAEYGTKEGKFLRVNLVSLVLEVYNRVDVGELPTKEGLAASTGEKAADIMNSVYESNDLQGEDEQEKITAYQEKKHEVTEKYYDKLISGEQKKLDELLEGSETPGTAEEKEHLEGEISRLQNLKEERLAEYKSDKRNAVFFKIIGERISDLAANTNSAEDLSKKIPDDFKPVAKRNNAMKGRAETWMKSLGYSK